MLIAPSKYFKYFKGLFWQLKCKDESIFLIVEVNVARYTQSRAEQ